MGPHPTAIDKELSLAVCQEEKGKGFGEHIALSLAQRCAWLKVGELQSCFFMRGAVAGRCPGIQSGVENGRLSGFGVIRCPIISHR